MSAIFNGSTSFINVDQAVIGATPSYPVAIFCWAKVADTTAQHTLVGCTRKAATGGGARQILLQARGDIVGDTIRARSQVGAANSNADAAGYTANNWHACFALFSADNSRQAKRDGEAWTAEETTSRAVDLLDCSTIGARFDNNAAGLFLTGRVAEVAVWTGITAAAFRDTYAPLLAAGRRPTAISEILANLVLYQPLRGAVNELGCLGPSLAATDVTWDSADHPITYLPPPLLRRRRRSVRQTRFFAWDWSNFLPQFNPRRFAPSSVGVSSPALPRRPVWDWSHFGPRYDLRRRRRFAPPLFGDFDDDTDLAPYTPELVRRADEQALNIRRPGDREAAPIRRLADESTPLRR